MQIILFDCETNGLLPELTKLHSLVMQDLPTGDTWSLSLPADLEAGVRRLMDADVIIAHNAIAFDVPAIQKVYPWFKPRGLVLDSLVCSRVIWPEIKQKDFPLNKRGKLPGKLIGSHSLEAWGYRLVALGKGSYKGEYTGGWERWSPDMQAYCEQDVQVLKGLWLLILAKLAKWGVDPYDADPPAKKDAIRLEHEVAQIIFEQERRGFAFDKKAAIALAVQLVEHRDRLVFELRKLIPDWEVETTFTPKVNNKKRGYVKGVPFTKRKTVQFNPGSRDHISDRLKVVYGWQPQEFGDNGKPTVDETTLEKLPYPAAKLLVEYLMVTKRLGALSEGNKAWLKVEKNGRIYGRVISNGAVTGRMTHNEPNLTQVPGAKKPYGKECRSLFVASPGMVLVDCDADALELRDLAGYMAAFDDGAYIDVVLKGKKEDGTDMHSVNCRALGWEPSQIVYGQITGRDCAKVFFYALIYGAGDEKLGWIAGVHGPLTINPRSGRLEDRKAKTAGKRLRSNLMTNLPALGRLVERVKAKVKAQGFLTGLDGRHLEVRSEHAALNTLLQSAGAIQMKRALVILKGDLAAASLHSGNDYAFVANVHDEWVIEAKPEHAERIGKLAADAIRKAGEFYGFRCPLAGNYAIGSNWYAVH